MTDVVESSVAAYKTADYAADNASKMAGEVSRLALLMPSKGKILDAGCGPGRDLARFELLGHAAVGVDLNPAFVSMATNSGHQALRADMRTLPFEDSSFDAIWACASLVHLPATEAAAALIELRRVARNGAPLYASVKVAGDSGWQETRHGRRYFEVWTPEAFAQAVRNAGFGVASIEPGPVFVDVWSRAT